MQQACKAISIIIVHKLNGFNIQDDTGEIANLYERFFIQINRYYNLLK